MAQFIKNRWVKIITTTAIAFLLLFVIAAVALQSPAVQTKVINYLSSHISKKTGYNISIERISLKWFDRFTADKMEVYDLEQNLMIRANDVLIDYELRALIGESTKVIDFVEINEAEVNARVININDTVQNLNLTEFINRLRALNQSPDANKPFVVIEEVALKNSIFTYFDHRKDSLIPGFNYNKFRVENINAHVNELYAHADTLQMQIQDLTANAENNQLPIHKVTGQLRYSKKALEFNDIEIHIGKSIIRDTVVMAFNDPRDLRDFNHKVDLNVRFKNALIHTDDLSLFVPLLKSVNDKYRISGNFEGKIDNFNLTNASLSFGKNSNLKGTIRMEGLPNIEETFMNYKLFNSQVLIVDLKPYLKSTTLERLQPLHHLQLNGQVIGFVNDFVAKGSFQSQLGQIDSDINIKLAENINNSAYKGKISLTDFDLGTFTKQPAVNLVSLNGEIAGKGLSLKHADFKLKGTIQKLDFNNYTYRNINTNGRFKKLFFEGNLDINDPNAVVSLNGSIDLQNDEEKFNLTTAVKKLRLKPLNLSKKRISIAGNAVINASGLNFDSLLGDGIISGALIKVENQSLKIDSLNFHAQKSDSGREFLLNSDLVNLKLSGNFTPTEAYSSIRQLLREYALAIDNNRDSLINYYSDKKISAINDFKLNFDILVKNFNPFLNLIQDSLYVAKGTTVKGNLTNGYTSIFTLDMKSDSIRYRKNAFKDALTELTISKIADSTDVLGMVYIKSREQDLGPVLKTENLEFESIWNNNHIDFEFMVSQQNSTNHGNIQGNIDFLPENIQVTFNESDILLFENHWQIPTDNLISFSPGKINFKNLEIRQGYQEISINGLISKVSRESLEIKFDSVELYNLNPLLRKPINGRLNGRITLVDMHQDLKINAIAGIENFLVDSIKVGNITGSTFYNELHKKSNITLVVERDSLLVATVQGSYMPDKPANKLTLETRINKAPLKILEPFLKNYFTGFRGTASGLFQLKGSFLKPIFEGEGIIEDAGIHVNYLNTTYSLNGGFSMAKNSIIFKDLNVTDIESNKGIVQGAITHDFFNRFALDLSGSVNNLLVLNTTSNDNDLYYGTGYGTGTVSFKGPVNNLNISAQAKTEAGTRIFIPIGETGEVQKQEFINFIDFADSSAIESAKPKPSDLSGFSFNLALDVTPDAYTELIFDIKSGDIIRGRGEGDLRLQIDPTGEFSMFGDFYIHQGGYNFTLYNIVNKEFEILPNSRISWYGDPYQGQMDIEATYEQLASLRPVIPQVETLENEQVPVEIKRKYPSRVLMNLNGPLLTPKIEFDIEVQNLPNYQVTLEDGTPIEMNFLFSRFKDSWDEQELNRQVFSLIVLRRFSPLQSFNTGGTIASSVSELLSNQLSYWVTQVNENLEIDVDLGSLDEEAFNTFQLRLAYTMFDGRLRIIRDGGFTNPYNNSPTKIPGIIGDWTVEYLLTPDGKLRVKMYNRTSYNTLDVNNQNSILTTGFSIQHIQSFDELKELFKKKKEEDEEDKKLPENKASNKAANVREDEIL